MVTMKVVVVFISLWALLLGFGHAASLKKAPQEHAIRQKRQASGLADEVIRGRTSGTVSLLDYRNNMDYNIDVCTGTERISLTRTTFDVEGYNYDFLQVGGQRYSGSIMPPIPLDLSTDSNGCIRLYFHSDYSVTRRGFSFDFRGYNVSTTPSYPDVTTSWHRNSTASNSSCGSVNSAWSRGNFTLPTSPDGSYWNSMFCTYQLCVYSGYGYRSIVVNFSYVDIEACGPQCGCDYLQIGDIKRCGTNRQSQVARLDNNGCVNMTFRTDGSVTNRGFSLSFEGSYNTNYTTPPTPYYPNYTTNWYPNYTTNWYPNYTTNWYPNYTTNWYPNYTTNWYPNYTTHWYPNYTTHWYPNSTTGSPGNCGRVNSSWWGGNFALPPYGEYANYMLCMYQLCVSRSYRSLLVDFSYLSIEECGSECYCDYLQIGDIKRCGNNTQSQVARLDYNGCVNMTFKTDGSVTRRGFSLSFQGSYNTNYTTPPAPHYPNYTTHWYPNYTTNWYPNYTTHWNPNYTTNWYPNYTTHWYPNYTTNWYPNYTTHWYPNYTTHWYPNYTTHWYPNYTTGNPGDCGHVNSSWWGGNFTLPPYGEYGNNMYCTYQLCVSRSYRSLLVDFSYLSIEECGSECYCDYLQIGDIKRCGNNAQSQVARLDYNGCVNMTFRTDGSVTRRGFSLSFQGSYNTNYTTPPAPHYPNYTTHWYPNYTTNWYPNYTTHWYPNYTTHWYPNYTTHWYPNYTTGNPGDCGHVNSSWWGGNFTLPPYGSYWNNMYCTYQLCVSSSYRSLVVDFSYVDIEACGPQCGCDYLQIGDIKRCGTDSQTQVARLDYNGCVNMTFRTDGSVTNRGFSLSFRGSYDTNYTTPSSNTTNYPPHNYTTNYYPYNYTTNYYPYNYTTNYYPYNYTTNYYPYNYTTNYYPYNYTTNYYPYNYTTNYYPYNYTTNYYPYNYTTNYYPYNYTTSSSNGTSGNSSTTHGPCGQQSYSGLSGTIHFPPGGGQYSNNMDCLFSLCPGTTYVEVTVTRMDIETASNCVYDALIIGSSRYCGIRVPDTQRLSGCSTIRFTSDGSVTGTGFTLNYRGTNNSTG